MLKVCVRRTQADQALTITNNVYINLTAHWREPTTSTLRHLVQQIQQTQIQFEIFVRAVSQPVTRLLKKIVLNNHKHMCVYYYERESLLGKKQNKPHPLHIHYVVLAPKLEEIVFFIR